MSLNQPNEIYETEPMTDFQIDRSQFGYKYFDDEEENSKEYLKQLKAIEIWFGQIALRERSKVIKQWREMGVQAARS